MNIENVLALADAIEATPHVCTSGIPLGGRNGIDPSRSRKVGFDLSSWWKNIPDSAIDSFEGCESVDASRGSRVIWPTAILLCGPLWTMIRIRLSEKSYVLRCTVSI